MTALVLTRGFYWMYKGNAAKQQRFMRYRVGSQALTVLLIVAALQYEGMHFARLRPLPAPALTSATAQATAAHEQSVAPPLAAAAAHK